jgi:hypothetical protein
MLRRLWLFVTLVAVGLAVGCGQPKASIPKETIKPPEEKKPSPSGVAE